MKLPHVYLKHNLINLFNDNLNRMSKTLLYLQPIIIEYKMQQIHSLVLEMKVRNKFDFKVVFLLITLCFAGVHVFGQSKSMIDTWNSLNSVYSDVSELVLTPSPTITLTDVTNLILNTVQGIPVSQTLNVSGVNLNVDLGIAITGNDASLFSLSQNTVVQTSGTVPNTNITITYSPVSAGSNIVTLTMSSAGAMPVTRTLTGNTIVATNIEPLRTSLIVSALKGNIFVRSSAGETIEIYNSTGQKLIKSLTLEGLTIIPLSTQGVLLVKVGNKVVKVIM